MGSRGSEAKMPPFPGRSIHFASFNVTSQVFYLSQHCFAVVNLKPLLPGHILVSPLRVLPRLADLSTAERNDLFSAVARIQTTLTRVYQADGFNVAVQDGEAAGQSVPHVHCHVIPRRAKDAGGDDKIHEWLEGDEGDVGRHQREAEKWPSDAERKPRSKEVMEEEARWLRAEMEKEKDGVEDAGRL